MAYMTKKTYADKLLDPRWQKKKNLTLERDNYTCQYCKLEHKTLNVHHFCYLVGGDPCEVPDDALITLCDDCHFIEHCDDFTELEKEFIEFYRMLELKVPGINVLVNKMILTHHKNPYSNG